MCSGSGDGSIFVWGAETLAHERTLRDEEEEGNAVYCLAAWEGRLLSGHDSGAIRVWDVATGVREGALDGHSDIVRCLAVLGARLVSGSDDRSVKVWAMGPGPAWPCERTLDGQVYALAAWRGKVVSGTLDGSEQPRLIELTCHQVLAAVGDARSATYLAQAHHALQTQANAMTDVALRHSFLTQIPEHRAIVAAWEAQSAHPNS